MNLVDTHAHLYLKQFSKDYDKAIKRAIENNVKRLYFPSIDSSYYKEMKEIRDKYPENVFLMMGLHPCSVKRETYKKELDFVENKLNSEEKFSAIGEIGLDLYWDKTTLDIQKEAFIQQIKWAEKLKLPINIHSRNSLNEVITILSERKEKGSNINGTIHCFSGDLDQAQKIVNLGFTLGIGGVITFKNAGLDLFLNNIPLENIVLETDAPYLAPVPYRGKRNESAYIPYIVEKLSTIYKKSFEEIAEITTKNALTIYK